MNNLLSKPIIIGLVAGEISGDILGARLIKTLQKYLPKLHFVGIAGPNMRSTGMETWYNMEELSVMGIMEVIKHLSKILRIRQDLINRYIILKPDVFIGIDSPEFTIPLENKLKKNGIPTIHYVSPSIWAWRKRRILQIKKATDKVLVLFPFEKILYDNFDIPCQFIGHTLADIIPLNPDKHAARNYFNLNKQDICLVLLPGSRQNEIERLSAVFLRAAMQIYKLYPNLKILVPMIDQVRTKQFEYIKNKITPNLPVTLLDNQSHQAMIAADIALVASGTATLECMLAKCPMVVGYRMNPITFALAKMMVNTSWISIPNLLARKTIVTELIQHDCNPHALTSALISLLNKKNNATLLSAFYYLHKQIKCEADQQAAQAVLSLIK